MSSDSNRRKSREVEVGEDLVVVRNVKKNFGGKQVHKGINLTVKRGEILTLMGGSGSGKSVLLRSMIGLERPDSGSILFHGEEVTGLPEEKLVPIRKRIAYVFQYGALFDSQTVLDNLAYPLREHTALTETQIRDKVGEALEAVGLAGSENNMPGDLSGGMQRRVGVARGIILEPEVILYDEPTTGLDPFNTRQLLGIMKKLQGKGVTSVLVTHDMHSIFSVTDRVAFLKDGYIHALGPASEIEKSNDPDVAGFIRGETP